MLTLWEELVCDVISRFAIQSDWIPRQYNHKRLRTKTKRIYSFSFIVMTFDYWFDTRQIQLSMSILDFDLYYWLGTTFRSQEGPYTNITTIHKLSFIDLRNIFPDIMMRLVDCFFNL